MADASIDRTPKKDYRLVPIAAAIWIGTISGLAGLALPHLIVVNVLLIAGIFGTGWTMVRQRHAPETRENGEVTGRWATTMCALFVGGFLSLTVSTAALHSHMEDPVTRMAAREAPLRVDVTVTGDPTPKTGSWGSETSAVVWLEGRTTAVKDGSTWRKSNVKIVLETDGATEIWRGDRLQVFGSVKTGFRSDPPSVGVLRARTVVIKARASGWQAAANHVRERLAVATDGLPANTRGLIMGMSIGDDRVLDPEMKQAMLTTSLTHLTAVSGSHIAIVLSLLTALVPGVKWLRPSVMFLFLFLLVAVVGPEPSVLRASWSAAIVGWGMILRRGGQPQAVLSAVVVATLLLSPWMAISFGFALSVLATWGILFTGRAWMNRFAGEPLDNDSGIGTVAGRRIVMALKQATAISLAAQIWVFPVTLLMNPWLPSWGVLANVAVIPAVAPVTVLGLLAAALSTWPAAAEVLCRLAAPFASWMEVVATTCARLPGARMPWAPSFLGVGAAILLIGLVVVITRAMEKKAGQ